MTEKNTIPEKFLKPYNAKNVEEKIYTMWEDSVVFSPETCVNIGLAKPGAQTWTTLMPPPNANGRLHAGHALDMSLKDIMTRFKRMCGYRALFVPGADHAGFETQVVYEKKLEKEGRSRFKMNPKQLFEEIYQFTLENKAIMESDIKRMGTSCDWSRSTFTLDPVVVKQVQETFVKMYNEGLVYRGKRIVNWCTKHQTSLSELETKHIDKTSKFYYLQYGPFVIGTARPETKFADKYIVVHPEDKRYAQYEHGQKFEIEWINGPIIATLIKDEAADPEMGSGAMTITPWHSDVDFQLAQKHNLEVEQIIDWYGRLLPIAGEEFEGLKIHNSREKIIEKLKTKGLVVKIDQQHKHTNKVCYKCERVIEPQVKPQWFVKMDPLTKIAKNLVQQKEVTFVSEQFEKTFFHWMNNPVDWNISRQIVWGIQIPAWFNNLDPQNPRTKIQLEKPDGEGWHQDQDTFDTWFSLGQWPLVALGGKDSQDFKDFYPTQLMETGRDLIFKWIPRMIIFGGYLDGRGPFKDIYLHGMVNDAKGKKMSKSKGNTINPVEVADEYGIDALRMALVIGTSPGSDTALSYEKIRAYKKFANKLWNIARFVLTHTQDFKPSNTPILSKENQQHIENTKKLIDSVTKNLENLQMHMAAEDTYHYLWHTFADQIIEQTKKQLENPAERAQAQYLLVTILKTSLTLLHPFMPFITEEIWQNLPKTKTDRDILAVQSWPQI